MLKKLADFFFSVALSSGSSAHTLQCFPHNFPMTISQFSMTISLLKFCIRDILWQRLKNEDFLNHCYFLLLSTKNTQIWGTKL